MTLVIKMLRVTGNIIIMMSNYTDMEFSGLEAITAKKHEILACQVWLLLTFLTAGSRTS